MTHKHTQENIEMRQSTVQNTTIYETKHRTTQNNTLKHKINKKLKKKDFSWS